MLVDLTEDERDFLYDKAFWGKMNASLDMHIARTPEAKEYTESVYNFYNNMCIKLEGDKNGNEEENTD